MKRFDKMAAQGDVMFIRRDALPANATEQQRKREPLIVTHSESGHHHAFGSTASVWLYATPDELVSYLDVRKPAILKHHRPNDTHEALLFDVGIYEVRRQREYVPDGWRVVVD